MDSDKLRHLPLEPVDALFRRPQPQGNRAKPITDQTKFKSMLTPLLSSISYQIHQKESVYYTIEFHIPYDQDKCQKAIKFLKATIKEVLNPYTLIVYSPKERLKTLEEMGSITKYTLEAVKEMKFVDHTQQLGRHLIDRMKDDGSEFYEEITIVLHAATTRDDYQIAISELNKVPNTSVYSEYPELSMITIKTNEKGIKIIKELHFVEHIFLKPIVAEDDTEAIDDASVFNDLKITFEKTLQKPTTSICVVDGGCNLKALGFEGANDDETGHGTKVASIACFGTQLLERKMPLKHEFRIISHKLTHSGEADIIRGIISAIETYKHECKVFCVSYNFYEMDPAFRKVIAERLDRYIQKQNVIVVNSTGNIPWGEVYVNRDRYPTYVPNFEVLCPSECRSIISAGNCYSHKNGPLPACNSRYGTGKIFFDKPRDEILYQKPEICTIGGTIDIATLKKTGDSINLNLDVKHATPVITKKQEVVLEAGSSFSAPLVANAFARLFSEYGTEYTNCETFKAILLNKTEYALIPGQSDLPPMFILNNLNDIEYCKDSVYMQFEGVWTPSEQFETRDKKPHVKGYEVKFHVPKGINKIRVAIFHSNNYPLQKIDKPAISFVIKVLKPNGKAKSSKYNTLAKPTHVHYGVYKVEKTETDDMWSIQFKIWGYNVPKDLLSTIKVRFGISIRLYPENPSELKELYELVKNDGKIIMHATVIGKSTISSGITE